MATIDLGKIKLVNRGAYDNSAAYTPDDLVQSGGTTYICIQNSTGNAVTNASYWSVLAASGTDGTDVGTTLTTQGDILYRDGSGLQRLAKGSANQTLQMNGSANAPTWVTAASGNTVKLGQVLPSANSTGSVTFDNLFDDTTYMHYYISADNVSLHSDSSEQMYMRFLNSSGTEQGGANYRWGSIANYYGSGSGQNYNERGWNDDKIKLFGDNISMTSDNYRGWSCLIYIRQPNQSVHRAEIQGFCTGDDGGGASGWNSTIHGYLNNANGINIRGFKIYTANNQTFAAGSRWTLYGVKL